MLNGSSRSPDSATIVVTDGLAARQWEAHLAGDRLARGEPAWLSPPIESYRNWTASLWSTIDHERPLALTMPQSRALWLRIVAESAEGAELIGSAGAADWAADAWNVLCNWQVDPSRLVADEEQADFRAFLSWCRRYRGWLRDAEWTDQPQLDALLPNVELEPPAQLILADLDDLSPARTALLSRLGEAGCRIERLQAPKIDGMRHRACFADSVAELHAAAGWLSRRLAQQADARVALIVPDLHERFAEVERALASTISLQSVWHSGEQLTNNPLIGAALNAIELVSPQATFTTFSRWLRSPFFADSDPSERSARAMLEMRLRSELGSQLRFTEAYGNAGLREIVRHDCPIVATAIDDVLNELRATRIATPSRWAKLWQRSLTRLGWPMPSFSVQDPALHGWERALDSLAQLTPVLGMVAADQALQALESILQEPQPKSSLPLTGVHVFTHVDEVGPGYEAVWVTGFTDTHWPQVARSNPLLPRSIQRAHRMPWYSPQDARDRSARSLAKLFDRVPDLVISWPARMYDYPTQPSPSIRALPDLAINTTDVSANGRAAAAYTPRARETVTDEPPPVEGHDIVGGVAALNRQARCPLRAFCEYRLGARALEPVTSGIGPRFQGIVAHRALELLLQTLPSQREIAERLANFATIDSCVERALLETFGDAKRSLSVLFELERVRLVSLIGELLNRDSQRAAFKVDAVEQRQSIRFESSTLRVRIDRLDRLADGSTAVIDYKTGGNAGSTDWFRDRLLDTQVPIYAVHAAAAVSAAVIAQVRADGVAYSGIWKTPDSFPGNARKLPHGRSWPDQIGAWREQIRQLIDEFTAGDTRLFTGEGSLEEARGVYSPLSRVTEQIALRRGSLTPW